MPRAAGSSLNTQRTKQKLAEAEENAASSIPFCSGSACSAGGDSSGGSSGGLAPGRLHGFLPCKAKVTRRRHSTHITSTNPRHLVSRHLLWCFQQRQHTHSPVFSNNHSQLTAAAAAAYNSSSGWSPVFHQEQPTAPCTCVRATAAAAEINLKITRQHAPFHQWSLMGSVTSASTR